MARSRTANIPDLASLLNRSHPDHSLVRAVERAMFKGVEWAVIDPSEAERIAVRLAILITLGQIPAGQRLLEQDISDVMAVSRPKVREALKILQREQLVVLVPRRGALVTAPDPAELNDIFTVRSALHQTLLAQLMNDRPTELARVMQDHLRTMALAARESPRLYAVESLLLTAAIVGLSSNPLLATLLKSFALRTLRYVCIGRSAQPKTVATSLRTWRRLLQAVKAMDTAAVQEIAVAHVNEMRRTSLLTLKRDAV